MEPIFFFFIFFSVLNGAKSNNNKNLSQFEWAHNEKCETGEMRVIFCWENSTTSTFPFAINWMNFEHLVSFSCFVLFCFSILLLLAKYFGISFQISLLVTRICDLCFYKFFIFPSHISNLFYMIIIRDPESKSRNRTK